MKKKDRFGSKCERPQLSIRKGDRSVIRFAPVGIRIHASVMPSSDSFPSQIDFRFLSVPDVQQVTQEHDAVDHDAFCRTGSSASIETAAFDAIDQNTFSRGGSTCLAISASLDRDIHVPVNHISPDVHARLYHELAKVVLSADKIFELLYL